MNIQKIITNNPGRLNIILHLQSNVGTAKKIKIKDKKISSSNELLESLRDEFGSNNIWIN